MTAKGHKVSFWGDGNILKLNCNNIHTTLQKIYKRKSFNCTLKMDPCYGKLYLYRAVKKKNWKDIFCYRYFISYIILILGINECLLDSENKRTQYPWFLLGAGHVGTLCLTCSKTPDSQKERYST